MKRKRILKILKFKGGEGLNLMCCGSGYETHATNARKSPHAYNDAFASAHEARPGRYDEPRKHSIRSRRTPLERYIKFIASGAL